MGLLFSFIVYLVSFHYSNRNFNMRLIFVSQCAVNLWSYIWLQTWWFFETHRFRFWSCYV